MKKSDKQVYKQAVKAIDFEQLYSDLVSLDIINTSITCDIIKNIVNNIAKKAVKAVAVEGQQHCIIDDFPFRVAAWYDSGDIHCEIITYICKSKGSNVQKTNKCKSGGEDPCCGTGICCSGL